MDTTLALINAAGCGLIALVLAAAILSTRVHDGIVIKAGLISMALGFGSLALRMLDRSVHGIEASLVLVNAGLAVVIVGYLWRKARSGHSLRRKTDWSDL